MENYQNLTGDTEHATKHVDVLRVSAIRDLAVGNRETTSVPYAHTDNTGLTKNLVKAFSIAHHPLQVCCGAPTEQVMLNIWFPLPPEGAFLENDTLAVVDATDAGDMIDKHKQPGFVSTKLNGKSTLWHINRFTRGDDEFPWLVDGKQKTGDFVIFKTNKSMHTATHFPDQPLADPPRRSIEGRFVATVTQDK